MRFNLGDVPTIMTDFSDTYVGRPDKRTSTTIKAGLWFGDDHMSMSIREQDPFQVAATFRANFQAHE